MVDLLTWNVIKYALVIITSSCCTSVICAIILTLIRTRSEQLKFFLGMFDEKFISLPLRGYLNWAVGVSLGVIADIILFCPSLPRYMTTKPWRFFLYMFKYIFSKYFGFIVLLMFSSIGESIFFNNDNSIIFNFAFGCRLSTLLLLVVFLHGIIFKTNVNKK